MKITDINPKDIKKLATKKLEEAKQCEKIVEESQDEEIYNNGECHICMSVMVEPVYLPCKHLFCAQCVVLFLSKKSECPLDRIQVPKNFNCKVDQEL